MERRFMSFTVGTVKILVVQATQNGILLNIGILVVERVGAFFPSLPILNEKL
jgi:hypothetical protein